MTAETKSLCIDPERLKDDNAGSTGIFVRAQIHGSWDSVDIYDLTRESLIQWLRSHGQHNRLAESCVLILLGHRALTEEELLDDVMQEFHNLDDVGEIRRLRRGLSAISAGTMPTSDKGDWAERKFAANVLDGTESYDDVTTTQQEK